MEGKRVLVTGGAGFIGSNLANHLAEANDVLVVDDCSLGTPANLEDGVALREQSVLANELPTDVDVIFHLAALPTYAMHEADPTTGTRINVEGFVNVLEQARADGCGTVVYASTSSVYGSHAEPSSETMDVTAQTGYTASKLARERYAEYFSTHYGLSVAGMRYFSIYQGYAAGERHKGEYANVISQFADDIAHGRSPTVYGDGTQTRDFVHVDDVVRATVLAATCDLDGVYNVGTGESHSFNDVVAMLNEILQASVDPKYVETPMPEQVYVTDTCADRSKLRAATGWEPAVDLRSGLERVCAQYECGPHR